MVEKKYRGSIAALPSNRLLRFEGKAGDDQGIKPESVGSGIACAKAIFKLTTKIHKRGGI